MMRGALCQSSIGIESIHDVQRKCQLELDIVLAYELCMVIVSISMIHGAVHGDLAKLGRATDCALCVAEHGF